MPQNNVSPGHQPIKQPSEPTRTVRLARTLGRVFSYKYIAITGQTLLFMSGP